MEALLSLPASPPFHLSTHPSNPRIPNPSSLPFHNHNHHHHKPTRTHRLQFKLFSSPSPTIFTKPTDPTLPDNAEVRSEDDEKFDWFSQWYPLSPIYDLDKRAPRAFTVMGLDVVVWWDKSQGKWQVFHDMCPHRMAPLSEGRINQSGRLQCVYHGWCFDGNGSCKYIPQALPDGPPVHTFNKACATVYPSFEQNKIVWFWPSTDPQYKDILMKEKPPYIPELDDPSYSCQTGIRDFDYGYEVLIENLMDPAHVPYAHHGIMKIPERLSPACRSQPDREGGRPLEITIQTLDKTGFLAKQENGYGKFIAPCIFYAYPSWDLSNGSLSSVNVQEEPSANIHQKQQQRFVFIFFCIPVSPGRSRVIWALPRNFAVWIDQIIPRWIYHLGQNLILDSDLYLLHIEELKIAKVGPSNWLKACFMPTKSDAPVIAFRKWLKKYSGSQVDWGTKFKGELPPTPPKEQLLDRYWSHVVHCSSCSAALKGLKALKITLQIMSFLSIGIVASAKESLMSNVTRTTVVSVAVLCFLASRWLSHFIYKNFYFHDYNHAFK